MTIECENLETRYSASLRRPILNGIDCTINTGEFVALLGLNGAGKSTLLRAMVGLVPLQRGIIRINGVVTCGNFVEGGDDGRDARSTRGDSTRGYSTTNTKNMSLVEQASRLRSRSPFVKTVSTRRDIGMLFQGGGLIRQLSAIENVLCGRLGGLPTWQTLWGFPKSDRRLALDLLAQLGLKEQAYQKTGQLSGGQQQRVAIARALIQNPQILLADEPITGLDVMAAKQVMEILSDLRSQKGMTIVTVLHDLSLASAYAERAIVLDAGRIVYDGPCQNLQSQFAEFVRSN
ncbi:ATP-binding cassette domain-containing protein [Planktothrix sp. FACHB-1355]|uniref:ATP-binding cassette domain-containing protein n=1 Tax=Aerosakkonema funiforme FACHB-1375 TaxID=2949571 RepID=A0A926ZJV8_9CYAN|nr:MULTISPECIES: ATP-binding cassette domain-containing protein [Oscillatoriales]MBD2183351.1 ATP-binding cassette domain-containing protein [Aerosakkonema funiforme FACHB-1375]MBD3560441.1 ATP-binding cassette domain-containing protein [Planktothrix sp. FACHB-1355]